MDVFAAIATPRRLQDAAWRRHGSRDVVTKPLTSPGPVPATPGRRREALLGTSEPVRVLGVGAGGIEELVQRIDSTTVAWALVRFQVGGGTFARAKLVAVHCNGADAPVMLRGFLKARSQEALAVLGDVNANVEVTCAKELTVEYICERLLPLFAADSMVYSLASLRSEYGKTVAELAAEAARRAAEEEAARRAAEDEEAARAEADAEPITALEKIKRGQAVSRLEALRAVGDDRGSYNWALLEPKKLELYNAGFGGLEEMKGYLADDQVLFGVLRLAFGAGPASTSSRSMPSVTKHVLVHWVGSRVGGVRRGVWCAKLKEACTLINSCSGVTFRREAHGLADLELEDLVAELRRFTSVDAGASKDGPVACRRLSAEEYSATLAEEARERREAAKARAQALRQRQRQQEDERRRALEQASQSKEAVAPELADVKAAVEAVSAHSGKWNWVLVGWPGPGPGTARAGSPRLGLPPALPPSPARGRQPAQSPPSKYSDAPDNTDGISPHSPPLRSGSEGSLSCCWSAR